ncbi:MAG: hypothetical protein JSV50_05740 [Desulfobacteraceae bacterium]|nr:MAG: hypothetical protein JSV50_05740 [Desulfobacteraceae bacterium]
MNKRMRWFAFLIIVLFVWMGDAFALVRGTGEIDGTTLRGIKSIYLQISPINAGITQEGLTTAKIQRDAERQLLRAGIKLLSEKEFNRLKQPRNYPLGRLEVMVTIQDIKEDNAKVYKITVRITQIVFLSRAPVIKLFAPTWESTVIGYSHNLDVISEGVRDGVAEFINAYQAANPK